ncbi:hypothetical protein RchiOBHm_Chr4g0412371 [Rosa chinensis]|uniref:Uncharacterized protein n=1 Tax=Rosa chinensis TaxID=74649 RepID=A0A2P6QVW6_ROSCH|nr:hypothetical protein RchiOBHm_Chr4g0412371 [Rosa chinensis]
MQFSLPSLSLPCQIPNPTSTISKGPTRGTPSLPARPLTASFIFDLQSGLSLSL